MAIRPGYAPAEPSWLSKPQVHALGESIAKQLGYEPGGDLNKIVELAGGEVKIQGTLLDDPEQSGSLYVDGLDDFNVIVPSHTSLVRDRFTLAHELGHYYLHYVWPKQSGKNIPDKVYALRKGSNRIEWEANWFGAAFLMPKTVFRAAYRAADGSVWKLADRFHVSTKAVEVRIQDLGLG